MEGKNQILTLSVGPSMNREAGESHRQIKEKSNVTFEKVRGGGQKKRGTRKKRGPGRNRGFTKKQNGSEGDQIRNRPVTGEDKELQRKKKKRAHLKGSIHLRRTRGLCIINKVRGGSGQ